jgi:hypothetical protein
VTLKAIEFNNKFAKVCLEDAFVYGFPKTWPQRLGNWSRLSVIDRFTLKFQRVAYEY